MACSVKVFRVGAMATSPSTSPSRVSVETSSSRPLALASMCEPFSRSSTLKPVCGALDRALDRVERVARQGGLGGDGHRHRGTDDGEATDGGGEPAFAGGSARRQREPGLLVRVHELGRGGGHQLLAQAAHELGAGLRRGHAAQRAHDLQEVGVPRVRRAGRGALDQGVELLGASARRECGHRSCPVLLGAGPPRVPVTRSNDARTGGVTGYGSHPVDNFLKLPISPESLRASASPGCVRRGAGAA